MANGFGKMVYADGNVYEGGWTEDKGNGNGIYSHFDCSNYKGEWFRGEQLVFGEDQLADRTKSEGDVFQNDSRMS